MEYWFRRNWFAHADRSLPLVGALERSLKNVIPYAPKVWEPGGYAGSLLFPLAFVGLLARRREKWPLLIAGGVGLAAFGRFPVVNDWLCRLPLFDIALNERLAFLWALALAVLAAFGVQEVAEGRRRVVAVLAAGSTAAVLAMAYFLIRTKSDMTAGRLRTAVLVQVIPLVCLTLLLLWKRAPARAAILTAALLALFLAQRRVEMGGLYTSYPSRAFYPPLEILDAIPRGRPERMTSLGFTFLPNTSALYELEDVRGYEAMTLAPLTETFPLWCVHQPVWFNRVDDPTKPFLSFLNVRYVLAPPKYPLPPGWPVLYRGKEGVVLENPKVLPRAFVPALVHRDTDPTRQRERLFAISDFGREGVLESEPAPPENGEARVSIESYSAQRMELAVEASRKTVVATSTTAWPGWRLFLDGREAQLLRYNRAFLAFEVPPGAHRAVMVYWPRSFVLGWWISALSGFATILLFAWPSRRPAPAIARSAATGENVRTADHRIHGPGSPTGSR